MNITFDNIRDEPREMQENSIDVVSTSYRTASASPIILKSTDLLQTKFVPTLVDNNKDVQKCVSGKLIYEKKKKKDEHFPTEKLSRTNVKVGEFMEMYLGTTETYALYQGLKSLYELYGELGTTPFGSHTYTKVDQHFKLVKELILNEPTVAHMLTQKENIDLVKTLLQIITTNSSIDNLKDSLKELEQTNIDALNNTLSIEKLERVLLCLKDNLHNSNEEDWQKIFSDNQWLISQMFSTPYIIFEDKAYVGGKSISNKGGNICDFLYRNCLTNDVALIEIKTPCTPIFSSPYRNTYSFSNELSGGINQVLNYKDSLIKDYYALCHNYENPFEAVNPKCFLIIGTLGNLDSNQIKALENYRNNFTPVQIVTFDELIQRTENFIALLNEPETSDEIITEEDFLF